MKNRIEQFILKVWYPHSVGPSLLARIVFLLLLPFSLLTALIVAKRYTRRAYRVASDHNQNNSLASRSCPIVVVGNITVGGTGKTPLISFLVNELKTAGYKVGVVARGYGATNLSGTVEVDINSTSDEAGDEALMLWRQLNKGAKNLTPVAVNPERNKAIGLLRDKYKLDVILCDDGLQHYSMARDFEIVVVDGLRGFGNGQLLPAGPLREKKSRLDSVDFLAVNGERREPALEKFIESNKNVVGFRVIPQGLRPLNAGAAGEARDIFNRVEEIVLVAGIGNPERFFESFQAGFSTQFPDINKPAFRKVVFPDHHDYRRRDFDALTISDQSVIVMTEKDGVKCEAFANHISAPAFTVGAEVSAAKGMRSLLESLRQLIDNYSR